MKAAFNKTGAERKALVTAIGEILERKPKYLGMPSAAYDFDGLIITKDGTAEFDESIYPNDIEDLLDKLAERGFTVDDAGEPEKAEEDEPQGLEISIPITSAAVGNLTNLLTAKGDLIQKALGITETPIEVDEEKIIFPWFDTMPDTDSLQTYIRFIGKLGEFSKKRQRVSAAVRPVENEKYAFRCFLLSLGFIGDEYKADRKILLKNLSGSSAFKNGGASHEISK